MKSVRILDVTLRDGGCVNNFNFGQDYMEKILSAQIASGVDIIELGYLDKYMGTETGRTQYKSERVIREHFLKEKKSGTQYLAMMDYGKFDVDSLEERRADGIDGIRLAFHKENKKDMIPLGHQIIKKGYMFFIQPMITLRYSDDELLELIKLVNEELPDASGFYIVDSFGEMRPNDMSRVLNLVDHNLLPSMQLGYHSHNNLQLSYSNAMAMINFPTMRDILLDSSIMGMGKGAGNLNTELLMEHLNLYYGKHYQVSPLLEVIDKVINQLHDEFYWGYAPEYYLSSVNHCTPSYASHFYNKHMLPIDQVSELLSLIAEDKKISFDKDYAEKLYRQYNESKTVDDELDVEDIQMELSGKRVLLVATGKSVDSARNMISKRVDDKDYIVIGLNSTLDYDFDYLLLTRREVYDEAMKHGKRIIASSAISTGGRGGVKILDYKKWVVMEGDHTYDSSTVLALNLLFECNIKSVEMIGFDGFSSDINKNYSDPALRHPITSEQAEKKNRWNRRFIHKMMNNGMKITFLTPSLYE